MSTTGSAAARSFWPANGILALVDFAAFAHRRAVALLILLSLLAFLPGFFQIPPVDRDEAYFAQATKQMVESGNYVDIHYQNDVRYRKPIGIYWLQAAAVKTAEALGLTDARTTIWLYRMPSLIGAIGAVLATYWCALAFVSRRRALLAALMLAVAPLLGVEARLAKTDAVLLCTIIVAMAVLARVYLDRHTAADHGQLTTTHESRSGWRLPALFWTALAAGILIKGPVIVMIVVLAVVPLSVIERSARWLKALRPLPGLTWMCLLVLPWFIAILWHAGSSFFVDSVGHDMLAKIGGGQETHGAPPGYYLVLFFLTFFPGSMLAVLAATGVWARRGEPAFRFLLAWLVPSWIVFELVMTKLPHYVLPLYPAVAILIALTLESNALSKRAWLVRGAVWWFIIPLAVAGAAIAGTIVIAGQLDLLAWPFFAAALAAGFLAWWMYEDDGPERSLVRAAGAAILLAVGLYAVSVPSWIPAFPSVTLATVLRQATCQHPRAASAGYQEPSLVFLAGTATLLTDGPGAADFMRAGDCRFAFVEADELRAFASRAKAIGLRFVAGPRVDGFNISTGRRISVAVFEPAGAS